MIIAAVIYLHRHRPYSYSTRTIPDLPSFKLRNFGPVNLKIFLKNAIWFLKGAPNFLCGSESASGLRWLNSIAGRLHRQRGVHCGKSCCSVMEYGFQLNLHRAFWNGTVT
jgi:hypothetical protein